jgi:hypothetical protein
MTRGEKILAWGAAGITAVLVTFGIIEAVKSKPSLSTPTTTGTTMSILLTAPSGAQNLGIVALPAGATLILGAPQGGSVGNVSFTGTAAKVAAQTGTAVSIQWTSQSPTSPSQATITWTDAANASHTSTVQIVPELSSTVIGLAVGTMPDLWLPASSSTVTGEMLFVPPAQQSTDRQLPVINNGSVTTGTSVTGTFMPGTTASPGGSFGVVAAANGTSNVSINWTDGSGNAQTSNFAVTVLPN